MPSSGAASAFSLEEELLSAVVFSAGAEDELWEEEPQPANRDALIAAVKRIAIDFLIIFSSLIMKIKKRPNYNLVVIETNRIRGATQID